MNIDILRSEIDQADKDLVAAFVKRMEAVEKISHLKKEENLPIDHPDREEEIIERLSDLPYRDELVDLYEKIFEISKTYQAKEVKR